MKPPEDIEDYSQCVRYDDKGDLVAFCVECDSWNRVAVLSNATIIYHFHKGKVFRKSETHLDFNLICQSCSSDINYLFSATDRDKLIKAI